MTTAIREQVPDSPDRVIAIVLAAASLAAMFYIGLCQGRPVRHIWCPLFAKGCAAAFAKPFGIPDGHIAATLFGAIIANFRSNGMGF